MPLTSSQLKQRVAVNLYHKAMTDIYGIQDCAFDYPNVQLLDDLTHIDLLDSGRDCRTLRKPPVHLQSPLHYVGPKNCHSGEFMDGDRGFELRPMPPIIIQFGTCVKLPISSCNLGVTGTSN